MPHEHHYTYYSQWIWQPYHSTVKANHVRSERVSESGSMKFIARTLYDSDNGDPHGETGRSQPGGAFERLGG